MGDDEGDADRRDGSSRKGRSRGARRCCTHTECRCRRCASAERKCLRYRAAVAVASAVTVSAKAAMGALPVTVTVWPLLGGRSGRNLRRFSCWPIGAPLQVADLLLQPLSLLFGGAKLLLV